MDTIFDIAVIGGGIAGIGVALAAAEQNFSTIVLERDECLLATSNNSLRIIHGGFRYLQQANIARIIESLGDQTRILNRFPRFVEPLASVMPLASSGMKSRIPVWGAGKIYGGFLRSMRSPLPAPKVLSASEVRQQIPPLADAAPSGALRWYDALIVDHDAFGHELIMQARTRGIRIEENVNIIGVEREGKHLTTFSESESRWTSRVVIDCRGPWLTHLENKTTKPWPMCKAFNIEVAQQPFAGYAVALSSASGRLFFCVPRGKGMAIGTWYEPQSGVDYNPQVSEENLSTFLTELRSAAPWLGIERQHVTRVDVGQLPMRAMGPAGPMLYGREQIFDSNGYIQVLSTKYTTFLAQGERAVKVAKRYLS